MLPTVSIKQIYETYNKASRFRRSRSTAEVHANYRTTVLPRSEESYFNGNDIFSMSSCPTNQVLLSFVMKLAQIYLLAPMSAASAERAFSVQRRVKHYSRNRMTQQRYNNLMMLHIHKERTDVIDLIKIARDFAQRSERRRNYFGKF